MNEKNLKVWLVISSDGSILNTHCTCMAGLGEVCSHSAAILFALNAGLLIDNESCTDKLATWPVPRVKNVVPGKISEMNWGRRILAKSKSDGVPILQGESLINFLEKVEQADPAAAILFVTEPFASSRKVLNQEKTPVILLNFYSPSFEMFSLNDLQNVELDFSVTKEEQEGVKKKTTSQSNCISWFKFRAGRITASNFKAACHTYIDNPSLTLIKGVCYPQKMQFEPAQIKYGKSHENITRNAYEAYMKSSKHDNVKIETTGFIISLENPQLGGSPDGIIRCDCCGSGCIEIKCPFTMKDGKVDIAKFSEMKGSCLIKNHNDYCLNKTHSYYYQVQLQMYVTKLHFCDFVIWSKTCLFIERIFYDANFCQEKVSKALEFHRNVIVPELLGRWYTQRNNYLSATVQLWCDCNQPENGKEMLRCGNIDCSIQWFHLNCVKLAAVPTVFWFCKTCSVAIINLMNQNSST